MEYELLSFLIDDTSIAKAQNHGYQTSPIDWRFFLMKNVAAYFQTIDFPKCFF